MLKIPLILLLVLPATATAQSRLTSIQPTSGPTAGGTLVVISGENLGSCGPVGTCFLAKVFFGGVEARVVARTNLSSMTVVTPPHAAGPVDVTYNYGGSLPNGFTYIDATAPPAIPTLSGWLLGALGIGLALIGVTRLKI